MRTVHLLPEGAPNGEECSFFEIVRWSSPFPVRAEARLLRMEARFPRTEARLLRTEARFPRRDAYLLRTDSRFPFEHSRFVRTEARLARTAELRLGDRRGGFRAIMDSSLEEEDDMKAVHEALSARLGGIGGDLFLSPESKRSRKTSPAYRDFTNGIGKSEGPSGKSTRVFRTTS